MVEFQSKIPIKYICDPISKILFVGILELHLHLHHLKKDFRKENPRWLPCSMILNPLSRHCQIANLLLRWTSLREKKFCPEVYKNIL
jgi:hypothetical protein